MPKIVKVFYERNKNLGNYQTVKLGVEIDVDVDVEDKADDVYAKARTWVMNKLEVEK